jgi:hypothetical protein
MAAKARDAGGEGKVTTNDVERLYTLLNDIDDRLRRIEQAEARRSGVDMGRGSVGRLVVSVAAVAAAVGSVVGVVVSVL